MGKRGPKPEGKVKIKWSPNFAYAIGLIVTDGNLSMDGRHLIFVSKDKEQINNYKLCLGLHDIKTGKSFSGYKGSPAYRVQFGDVLFYRFLMSIGITPAKSLTIGKVDIPDRYFLHFLRGCFDGDGCTYSYWDKRWRSSFMYYTAFASGSQNFLLWMRRKISERIGCKGQISIHKKKEGKNAYYQLRYAKKESIKLLSKIYYLNPVVHLRRKRLKIDRMLAIVGEKLSV